MGQTTLMVTHELEDVDIGTRAIIARDCEIVERDKWRS